MSNETVFSGRGVDREGTVIFQGGKLTDITGFSCHGMTMPELEEWVKNRYVRLPESIAEAMDWKPGQVIPTDDPVETARRFRQAQEIRRLASRSAQLAVKLHVKGCPCGPGAVVTPACMELQALVGSEFLRADLALLRALEGGGDGFAMPRKTPSDH